ncbi:MAG: amidohydrolase family protein [Daejeonella sp.]|uniref:amidohydrolase family protein n=1 Tax=Daejeonella sp. TaxID=2805397 RepID=UPI002733B2AC|nr:amidohydrolase family protein [Daejeonella sp.]MDP3469409.1 amidohydrolase family protein [Daejeonella sp.]
MQIQFIKSGLFILSFNLLILNSVFSQSETVYDIVISGGRVIDPETKLDTIKNVGIINNRIAQISSVPLKGKENINVQGLVVSPGFIDLHVHGRNNQVQEYQMHDGVTTALELEFGIENLAEWYASRKSKALINYGASVNWPFERFKSMDKYRENLKESIQTTLSGESSLETLFKIIGPSYTDNLSKEEMQKTINNIKQSLDAGGIGIGIPVGYLPKTKSEELFRIFKLAAELKLVVFSHVREPNILSIQEAISNAAMTGAALHLVHINSMALGQIQLALDMIKSANERGLDISTELYSYTAAATLLNSAFFDEGWQERLGISYSDLQWVANGERLTKETFDSYRKSGGTVIIHMMKPEWIKTGIAYPGVMIASDGMPYSALAHPRTAGTFSRVLGKYVREEKVLSLNEAIEKMTILPAKRLENISPMMRFKGRIQVGADADITIFNPATVTDQASFEKGLKFSAGIEYVLVNGVFVLKNGETLNNVFAGQPVYGKFKK